MSKMRKLLVTVATLALTVFVIGNAYVQKKQFYPSVVYITKSNPSMAVMYLQAAIIIWLTGKLMQKIFFGELRAAEIEHLIERFWYAITETCLAFTVFKDDFSPKFIGLFALLLFLKTFHWLAEDRVDFMERSPVISWLFHARIVVLLTLLAAIDTYFISFAYQYTITKGASVQLVFGFEYAILLTVIVNTTIKYVLHVIDMNREVFWENKAVFLLHIEVLIGFIKVALYLCFVALMIKLYTLPLFAFRPMYYSMRNFKKALNDVIQSRRAIRNMNTLYPDATTEELAAADNVCIICREEMQAGAKKLPCNHIFHVSCLRSWFQRHQTCPTCRLNVLRSTPEAPHSLNVAAAAPPPVAAAANAVAPPIFAFPAWQPPFFPPIPNAAAAAAAANLQQPNVPNIGDGARQAQPQPQPQPQPAATQQQNQAAQSVSADSTSQLPPSGATANVSFPRQFPLPFMMPPLPPLPPFIPGITTPPLPPHNWSGLSVDELRRMEDTARQGVEARLQCLKNIHTLMDASVILMQQYITSATIAAAATNSTATAAAATNVSQNNATAATTAAATATATATVDSRQENRATASTSNAGISESSNSHTDSLIKTYSQSPSTSTGPADSACQKNDVRSSSSDKLMNSEMYSSVQGRSQSDDLSEEKETLRRRRMEKFSAGSSSP